MHKPTISKTTIHFLFVFSLSLGAAHSPAAETINIYLGQPWPLADTLPGKPVRDIPRRGSSCETADKYVRLVDSHQMDKIGELFAENGVFLPPMGPTLVGRAAIGAWFAQITDVRHAIPLKFTDAGFECFMEIAGQLTNNVDGKYHLTAIDHFTMNESGEIARAVYYFRPDTVRATDALQKARENSTR